MTRYELADLIRQRGVRDVVALCSQGFPAQLEDGIDLSHWTVASTGGAHVFARYARIPDPRDLLNAGAERILDEREQWLDAEKAFSLHQIPSWALGDDRRKKGAYVYEPARGVDGQQLYNLRSDVQMSQINRLDHEIREIRAENRALGFTAEPNPPLEMLLAVNSNDRATYDSMAARPGAPMVVLYRDDLGLAEGATVSEVAATLGLSIGEVERRMSERGVAPKRGPNPRKGPRLVKLLAPEQVEALR